MKPLTDSDFTAAQEPFDLFRQWFADATASEPNDPNAMALATVDPQGMPDVRMVLMKGYDEQGFVFYTNTESPKAADLRHQPYASLCFYWNPPGRQVRVSGRVEPVSDAEADAYFNSRPYLSRIGAWASKQSKPLDGYAELERAVASTMVKHPRGRMPRPPPLAWLPGHPRQHRALAGAPLPPARTLGLHPHRQRLEGAGALSVSLGPRPRCSLVVAAAGAGST